MTVRGHLRILQAASLDVRANLPKRFCTELLELLWLLEATIERDSEQADLLDAIRDGPLIRLGDEL